MKAKIKVGPVCGSIGEIVEVRSGGWHTVEVGGILYHYLGHELEAVQDKQPALPTDSDKRKEFPMFSGLLAYFPAALAQVSNHSYVGNEKHNKGLPLQHARGISGDHEDCVVRHLVDAKEHAPGSPERIDELRGVAWRALALLQEELELTGIKPAPAATFGRKA